MKSAFGTKFFVDTNLWIRFLIGKRLSGLLDFLSGGKVEFIVSQELLDEFAIVAS